MLTTLIATLVISAPPDWTSSTVVGPGWYVDSGVVKSALLNDFLDSSDGGDYALAIERFQKECDDLETSVTRGCTLYLACGDQYELKTTADVCTNLKIVGCGTGMNGSGGFKMTSKTSSDPGTNQDAFRVWHKNETCPFAADLDSDINPTFALENVSVYNYDTTPSDPIAGIRNKAILQLDHVTISGFVQGVNEVCSNTTSPTTGCPLTQAQDVWLLNNLQAGWFREGSDANVGTFIGIHSANNCSKASTWNSSVPSIYCASGGGHETETVCTDSNLACAGFIDLSTIFNTYIGMHGENNKDTTPNPDIYYPSFVGGAVAAYHTQVGNYKELVDLPSYIGPAAISIGGNASYATDDNSGMEIRAGVISRAVFRNKTSISGIPGIDVKVGRAQNLIDSYLTLVDPESNWPMRVVYYDSTDGSGNKDEFRVQVNGVNQIRIGDEHSGGGGGELILPDEIDINSACWEFDTATHACD